MHRPDINLGELRSVHRPVTFRLWLMALVSLAPLLILGLGIAIIIDDLIHGRSVSAGKLATPIGCLGVVGLILALLIGFLVGEIRKWYPTRNVRLKVFERGFTYQDRNQIQACAWNEIKDITHRTIMVHSKHSAPRRVSIIRSIVKKDGTVIVLAEMLNLHKLTSLITEGKTSAARRSV
jgi:hypothetical protein